MKISDHISTDSPIVVAGAGGFIGGHLVSSLVGQGFSNIHAVDIKPKDSWFQKFESVVNLEADLSQRDSCYRVIPENSIVFNLAADMGGMGYIENHKLNCMLSVLINTHLLQASTAHAVQRYFYASSACVYRADRQQSSNAVALREEDAYPADPEDGYGWEKLFSERMATHFQEDLGLETRIARFHNIYGPFGTYDGGREKAPAAICRKVALAKLSGVRDIEIWGDGDQTRSFTYVDDAIEGIERLSFSFMKDPVNIGSDRLISINGLVDIVEDIAGIKTIRHYVLSAPLGVRGRNSDNTLIRKALDWAPSTTLEDGLEKTYKWVYDKISKDYKF